MGKDEVVIDGVSATTGEFTVRVAEVLVAEPAVLVTTTEKEDPLSEVDVAGVE